MTMPNLPGRVPAPGDVVTVLNGTRRFEVGRIDEGLAKVWPCNPDDADDAPRWLSVGLLRTV